MNLPIRVFTLSFLSLALLAGLAFSCRNDPARINPAFYYWQTRFELTPVERNYLDSLEVERLYFKAFDVDWDAGYAQPVPQATVIGLDRLEFPGELVPAVFITNRTLENLDPGKVEFLANHIHRKLSTLIEHLPPRKVPEIQIDCDWTEGTRDLFFQLLDFLRPAFGTQGIKLSATIRLHQVRYFERTGVPPVDRGMLMAYNTGDVGNWAEPNSILHLATLQPYLVDFNRYPLNLDLALPAFAWGALFREGRLVQLMHGLRTEDLASDSSFTKIGPGRFELRESMYFKGQYLYRGDRIRCEAPTPEMLDEAADLFGPYFSGRNMHLAFYHLDSAAVKHYPYAALQRVIKNFDPE